MRFSPAARALLFPNRPSTWRRGALPSPSASCAFKRRDPSSAVCQTESINVSDAIQVLGGMRYNSVHHVERHTKNGPPHDTQTPEKRQHAMRRTKNCNIIFEPPRRGTMPCQIGMVLCQVASVAKKERINQNDRERENAYLQMLKICFRRV